LFSRGFHWWNICWVRIFEIHVDVIGRGHHIPKGVNLHPHEVFYTKQGLLIPTEIIDGEYTCVSFNIYFSVSYYKIFFLYSM
jgi:hypothetical protein